MSVHVFLYTDTASMCVKSASNKKHKLQPRLMHPLRAKVKKEKTRTRPNTPLT